jgi:sulfite exporter TauE/SafE
MTEVTLLSVFLVGLLGGLHCAGMCGGIVSVMSASAARRVIPIATSRTRAPAGVLLGYNLGRVMSYTIAGALAGALGSASTLARQVLPLQQAAFLLANLMLIAMGLYLAGVLRSVALLETAGQGLWRSIRPLASRLLAADRFRSALGAGLVWGWVPCGMVYGVLIAALLTGSAAEGALLMLAFGAGTLPNLLLMGWSAGAARRWLDHRGLRVGAGVLVIGFGLAGLARLDPTAHLHQLVDVCLDAFRPR